MLSPRRFGRRGNLAMDVIQFIPRLMFFSFVALTVVLLVRSYIVYTVDVKDAEMEVQANRLIYSPACLAYFDETLERSYPGVVDVRKFQGALLDNCMHYGERNDYMAMNITLRPVDEPGGSIAGAVYNSEGWEAWMPRVGTPGPGGVTVLKVKRLVLYRDADAELKSAILDIVVVVPNA